MPSEHKLSKIRDRPVLLTAIFLEQKTVPGRQEPLNKYLLNTWINNLWRINSILDSESWKPGLKMKKKSYQLLP